MSKRMQSTAQKFHLTAFVASLSIGSFACNLSADTPQIRIFVAAEGSNNDGPQMLSALSRAFRRLDGVVVTDTQPALKITCNVLRTHTEDGRFSGCACSIAITDANGYPLAHTVHIASTIDALAKSIATHMDGTFIEQMRRAAQPSSSP